MDFKEENPALALPGSGSSTFQKLPDTALGNWLYWEFDIEKYIKIYIIFRISEKTKHIKIMVNIGK